MSAGHTPATPETSFEFIAEWFERAGKSATAKGNRDSAQLWSDGLQHLTHLNEERDRLKAVNAELAAALTRIVEWHTRTLDDGSKAVSGITVVQLAKARAALGKHQGEMA